MAALLHRAGGQQHTPEKEDVKYLLPKPALSSQHIKPREWVNLVQNSWEDSASQLKPHQAKVEVLKVLSKWPLFGSSFFAVSIILCVCIVCSAIQKALRPVLSRPFLSHDF